MPFPWGANQILTAIDLNAEFQALINRLNGILSPTALSANMALAYNKTTGILTLTCPDGVTQLTATVPGTPSAATSVTLFTPVNQAVGNAILLQGTFAGGAPISMDYSFDSGATFPVTVPVGTNLTVNSGTGTFSLTAVPGNSITSAAHTYPNGTIKVRDSNNHSAVGSAGTFMVFSPTPYTTPIGGGTLLFATSVADSNFTTFDSQGFPQQLNDASGSAMRLVRGPTTPGSSMNPANFSGTNKPTFNTATGNNGNTTMLGLTMTVNSALYDPAASFFDAGFDAANGGDGINDPLIHMCQTTDVTLSTDQWVIIFAAYLDLANVPSGSQYMGGPIWGLWPTTTSVAYITALRWHTGSLAAQYNMNGLGNTGGSSGNYQATPAGSYAFHGTPVWMTVVCQKNGTAFSVTVNKGTTASITVAKTGMSSPAFNPISMSYGGAVAPGNGTAGPPGGTNPYKAQTGNSYPRVGNLVCYTGVPTTTVIGQTASWVSQNTGNPV